MVLLKLIANTFGCNKELANNDEKNATEELYLISYGQISPLSDY